MKSYKALGCFLWSILVTMVVIMLLLAWTQDGYGQTPTPTPGPCAACPDPNGFVCALNYPMCVACWEACGQPIATPTPTPTPTPMPPTPTPTPPPGPECVLNLEGPGTLYMVGIWAHESETRCVRYTYESETRVVLPGPQVARLSLVEGYPIGYEWWDADNRVLLKSCGDTDRAYPCKGIFEDGFESGNTAAWSSTIGG